MTYKSIINLQLFSNCYGYLKNRSQFKIHIEIGSNYFNLKQEHAGRDFILNILVFTTIHLLGFPEAIS